MGGFAGWLARFTQVSGPIGDLARDVTADADWPDGPEELQTYLDHLEVERGLGAESPAAETVRQAWEHYQRARR